MEILAPAGSPESLQAAVRAGADAVYLGGGSFSARAFAHNFDDDALRSAVRYCHARGVRVHLAVNTLLRDEELERAVEFVRFACTLPVDAVLVQDTGLLLRLRACAPALPLHASTQMSLHTPSGAAAVQEAGMTRAVLAREMTAKEIRETRGAVSIELESFVHGALCMSVSGQCYFSAMLGSRSGNRGMCAQTCRLPFSCEGGTGHDLSLRDLSLIQRLSELEAAGVMSAKIEGRMKRPEYVAAAVSACRRAADGEPIPPRLLENLEAVFSRSGFTDGYLSAHRGRIMFGTRTKEDVESANSAVFAQLHTLYKNEAQRVPVTFTLSAFAGENPRVTVSDGENEAVVTAEDCVCEIAQKLPVNTERWEQQLRKTGGTPYLCEAVQIDTDEKTALPISVLNGLRREALEKLGEQRREKPAVSFKDIPLDTRTHGGSGRPKLRAFFKDCAQVPENISMLEAVILPLDADETTRTRCKNAGVEVILALPRALWGIENAVRARMEACKAMGDTHFYCGNLGALALCKELGVSAHGGFSLNVFNTECLRFFEEFGLDDTELSFELTGDEIRGLGGELPRGILLYGRQPLMLTRNCPLANSPKGCLNCKHAGKIRDRKGVEFPVHCTRFEGKTVYSEVFNSVPLVLFDRPVSNVDFGVLRFSVENAVETQAILDAAVRHEKPHSDCTRGLFLRGVL